MLDFGLAKRRLDPLEHQAASTQVMSQPGQVLGTPRYMSPEQAVGRAVDHRTDLFSPGAVPYELATGQAPFQGAGLEQVREQVTQGQPERMRRLNDRIPEELERIVQKCLEKA